VARRFFPEFKLNDPNQELLPLIGEILKREVGDGIIRRTAPA